MGVEAVHGIYRSKLASRRSSLSQVSLHPRSNSWVDRMDLSAKSPKLNWLHFLVLIRAWRDSGVMTRCSCHCFALSGVFLGRGKKSHPFDSFEKCSALAIKGWTLKQNQLSCRVTLYSSLVLQFILSTTFLLGCQDCPKRICNIFFVFIFHDFL